MLNRPRVMEEGGVGDAGKADVQFVETEEERVFVDDGGSRRSTDLQAMLSRRFGGVKQGTLTSRT